MAEPQVIVSHTEHDDPAHNLASPIAVTIPGQDLTGNPMYLIKGIGGLTKLEHVAAMICGECARFPDFGESDIPRVASISCDLAEALLAECAKRQAPKAEKPGIEVT